MDESLILIFFVGLTGALSFAIPFAYERGKNIGAREPRHLSTPAVNQIADALRQVLAERQPSFSGYEPININPADVPTVNEYEERRKKMMAVAARKLSKRTPEKTKKTRSRKS